MRRVWAAILCVALLTPFALFEFAPTVLSNANAHEANETSYNAPLRTDPEVPRIHHLVVLYTNDHHGHPVKFKNLSVPDVGGLPARATLVKRIRQKNRNVLLLDAGDLMTGEAESNFFQAKPDILGYNFLKYDAMVLGNHEFDNPLEVLKKQMDWARFPFLSANVKNREGDYLAAPYIIKQFSGFNVAILGLTTKETEITGNPEHIKDLLFEDEVVVAKEMVPILEKKADLIIALTHLGIYEGFKRGSKRLAYAVPGIDLIVDGNTDTRLDSPLIVTEPRSGHQTLIVQAWHWGLVLGKIDLWIQEKEIIDFRMELIPINLKRSVKNADGTRSFYPIGEQIMEDAALLALLEPYADKVERFLSEKIGTAKKLFENEDVRFRETALGNLVADSMKWYLSRFEPDFALTNSGAIRTGMPEGTVTQKTVYDMLPFNSSLVFLRLNGKQTQALFDHMGKIRPGEGAFPQVSRNLSFTLDLDEEKCQDIRIGGKPIDPNQSYSVVTNSYLANGGDGYRIFLEGRDRFDSSVYQRDALTAYIKHLGGKVSPEVENRIRLLPPKK